MEKIKPSLFSSDTVIYIDKLNEFFLIPGISEFDKVAVYKENPKNH